MSQVPKGDRDVRISKCLSYLLRHGAIKEKLAIDSLGNVLVEDILMHNRLKTHRCTIEDIRRVVRENNKQRFKLHEDKDGKLYISANQGHSIAVDDQNLVKLSEKDIPLDIFHGTYKAKLETIKAQGLSKMNRNHIHLTNNREYVRKSCNILIYIDVKKCMDDGMVFYKSDNNVYLTSGIDGIIPCSYFREIELI